VFVGEEGAKDGGMGREGGREGGEEEGGHRRWRELFALEEEGHEEGMEGAGGGGARQTAGASWTIKQKGAGVQKGGG